MSTTNRTTSGTDTTDAADWLEYGAAELQTRNSRRRLEARYNVQAEFLQPAGWISRTPEGKFVVADESDGRIHPSSSSHVYYSPATSPVVESGVYRIGGDRLAWPRPKPILRRELSPVPPTGPLVVTRSRPAQLLLPPHPASVVVSPQFGRHTIPTEPAVSLTSPSREIRSSSPGPGLLFSPSLANFSDMSSVRMHPGSAERSTTLSTSRLSSFQAKHQQQQQRIRDLPDLPPRKDRLNRFFPNTVSTLSSSVSPSDYIHELPALLPIHQQLVAQQSPGQISPLPVPQMRTVRAEVHSTETPRSASNQRVQSEFGLLLNTAGRHFHAPPPFRPPPPPVYHQLPYTISYPPSSLQRPLATSSPPRSRHFPPTTSFTPGPYPRRPDPAPLGSPRRRSPLTIAVRLSPSRTQQRMSERSRSQIVEYSPQSQSSSSGFDSKNTSQQNQSSQSGSGQSQLMVTTDSSSALWATSALTSAEITYVNWPVKALAPPALSLLDASVDNHYEFDTTQSPNETGQDPTALPTATFIPQTMTRNVVLAADSSGPGPGRHRKAGPVPPRSENIEARVQAMKEEFQEYRKRRARGLLESAC